MSATELRPYELPPFELVKLIQPAFQPQQQQQLPSSPQLGPAFQHSTSPRSPPGGGIAGARAISPPSSSHGQETSLSGRLSQLVSKRGAAAFPGSTAAIGFGASPSSSAGFASPEQGNGRASEAVSANSNANISNTAGPSTSPGQAGATKGPAQSIRSVEAGAESIWVAGNEGSVAVWKLDAEHIDRKGKRREDPDEPIVVSASDAAYLLDQYGVVPGRRPVEKLAVLPTVGKAVVLSEGFLTLHALPTFANLPALNPIKGVSTFAVDLSNPHADAIRLCVIKRRSMQLFSISHNVVELLKELPLRTTAIMGVLRRSHLCIADAVNYSLVNLDDATLTPLLPISQDPPDSPPSEMHDLPPSTVPSKPKSHQRPSIVAIENDEFLIASHTGMTTLGLFIKENGEPTRGTLEWASNPKSLAVDYPYVISLLHNNSIQVHSITTQELVQTISLSSLPFRPSPSSESPQAAASPSPATKSERIQARSLVSTTAGFPNRRTQHQAADNAFAPLLVPQIGESNNLDRIEVHIVPREPSTPAEKIDPEGPPVTPMKQQSHLTASRPVSKTARISAISNIAAKTLLVGKDSIYALCPLTLVVQAESLIANNKVQDALNMLAAVGPLDTPEKMDEACYVKQKAAWKLLTEMQFKQAGHLFLEGRTDPRILLHLFPDLCGDMEESLSMKTVPIYRGLAGHVGEKALKRQSIDAMIETNLVRNYSPHLPPASPTVTNLHSTLEKDAYAMLQVFLEAWREARRSSGMASLGLAQASQELIEDLDQLVDTALVKLYLRSKKKIAHAARLLENDQHSCDLHELEGPLAEASLHWQISRLMLRDGRLSDTLRVWTELVDGVRSDSAFTDGVTKVFELLQSMQDPALLYEYGLWLAKQSPDLGVEILTRAPAATQLDADACEKALRNIASSAADSFLEFTVFTRKGASARLHSHLMNRYIDQLEALFTATSLAADIQALREQYVRDVNTSETTIVSFALSKAHHSESMKIRGKLLLMLHGSHLYEAAAMSSRLSKISALLFEQAVVLGRLGEDNRVLSVLAKDLKDLASAEAYCTHAGGDVLSARSCREIIRVLHIGPFPSALYRKDGRRKHASHRPAVLTAAKEQRRKDLLNSLIKIQLEQSSPATASIKDQQRTAHVIETQAIRISAKEILPSIPGDWPLPLMESFLVRNMRRSLHEGYERKLVKACLQHQTLETSLRYWEATDALGGILEEEVDNGSIDGEKADLPSPSDAEVVHLEKLPLPDDDEKTVDLS